MSKARLINIRGMTGVDDDFYRYKMEEVVITSEGVKFAFHNVDRIAIALRRDPKEIVSFLQKHFGGQFQYKNGKVLTSKADLTKNSLQEAIYLYIESFVLCQTCKLPETQKTIEKKRIVFTCEACSAITTLEK